MKTRISRWLSALAALLAFSSTGGQLGFAQQIMDYSTPVALSEATDGEQAVAPAEACGCDIGCDWCDSACEPLWTARADMLIMQRSRPRAAVLVTDSFSPGGTPLLNARDFDFDTGLGWALELDRRLNACWTLQAKFSRIDSWDASIAPFTSAAGAVTQYVEPLGNTTWPAEVSAHYRSELNSFELNGVRQLNEIVSVLAGVRYLGLNEDGLTLSQLIMAPTPNPALCQHEAINDLIGFQLGTDVKLLRRSRFEVDSILKAGIYANDAHNSVLISQNAGPIFACAGSEHHTAFEGEIALDGIYRLSDHVTLHGGYQLMWIEGVALASDQIAVSNPFAGTANVDVHGSPFYHGAFAGVELTW